MIETIEVQTLTQDEIKLKGQLKNFPISSASLKTLTTNNFSYLFPIQIYTFEHIFQGKNILARDHTGSGKTLAFTLPLLERIRSKLSQSEKSIRGPQVLIIAPTRELAIQSKGVLETLQNHRDEFKLSCLYGGKNMFEQKRQLS